MKTVSPVLFVTVLFFGTLVSAQDKFEVYGEYSYLRFNPTITGLNSRSFNGGGGGGTFYFTKFLGIKGDFMGYGSTTFTKIVPSTVVLPNGQTIPAGSYTTQGNMFTYLFGPVIRVPLYKIAPFGEILFGGSNSNAYGNLAKQIDAGGGTLSVTGTQHPFTLAFGGGLDISVAKHISIRPGEVDYVLSRYTNPLTSTNNQNNFRYCGGVVFKF